LPDSGQQALASAFTLPLLSAMPPTFSSLRQLWQRLPFRFHWATVVLMAFLIPWLTRKTDKPGEFYPFSNFPMYASFTPDTYLVYITDQNDQPIPIKTLLGTSASDVKKTYDQKLNDLKSRAPKGVRRAQLPLPLKNEAANATLQAVASKIDLAAKLPDVKALRLYQTDISYRDDLLQQATERVGEISLP
jgi:hypothetical protein